MTLNFLKKPIEALGKNIKPSYPMVAIAITNGIFKPLTTMTDKNTSPETKKYTALREVLTEVVAVPTYLASNYIAEKGAEKLFKNSPDKMKLAKGNIGFMGVCAAAAFVIPALCSVVVKPFTDRIFKKNDSKKNNLNIVSKTDSPEISKPIKTSHSGNVMSYNIKNNVANNGGLRI